MLNKYLNNLEALVSEYSFFEFPQFEGPERKKATLDDLVWYYIDPKTGRKTRFLCTILDGHKRKADHKIRLNEALAMPYNYLLKIYIVETVSTPCSAGNMQSRIIAARAILTDIKSSLNDISEEEWRLQNNSAPFWKFCNKHKLLGSFNKPEFNERYRDRTGEELQDRRTKLLPDQQIIEALGQVFVNTFQDVDSEGRVVPGGSIDISNAIICTFAALSLASPNRMSAEIPVLKKQKLKNFSEGSGKPVFYLDWAGSKGFSNNRNHILAALSDNVSKGVNFFYHYCEPYRVIARFYEKPNHKWKDLLLDIEVESERQDQIILDSAPNLFTLAYALGLYKIDETVLVVKNPEISKLKRQRGGNLSFIDYLEKPIHQLCNDDVFYTSAFVSNNSWSDLFGTGIQHVDANKNLSEFLTLKELEEYWFNHFKTEIAPSFPYAYSGGENYAFYSDLLFCLPRVVLSKNTAGGKVHSKSFFALYSPKYIAQHVSARLKQQLNNKYKRPSVFEENGYGKEMSIRPHQLRHFGNTMAHLSDIAVAINTAWSGRKSVNQTFEYIHTTDHEESDRLSSVLNFSNGKESDIRIITSNDLAEIANLPASVTSTGVCIQELNVSPCEYLNDFVSQCFMCSSACHIAGDQKAIDLFEKDFVYQKARLEQVRNDSRVQVSKAMQEWLVIHHRNTEVLKSLILLMKEYPVGSIIRFSQRISEFKVTDLSTKRVETVKFALPASNSEIKSLRTIGTSHVDLGVENSDLNDLLSSFGLTEE